MNREDVEALLLQKYATLETKVHEETTKMLFCASHWKCRDMHGNKAPKPPVIVFASIRIGGDIEHREQEYSDVACISRELGLKYRKVLRSLHMNRTLFCDSWGCEVSFKYKKAPELTGARD